MIDDTHTHIHNHFRGEPKELCRTHSGLPQTTQKPSKATTIDRRHTNTSGRARAPQQKAQKITGFCHHRRCGIEKTLCQRAAQN